MFKTIEIKPGSENDIEDPREQDLRDFLAESARLETLTHYPNPKFKPSNSGPTKKHIDKDNERLTEREKQAKRREEEALKFRQNIPNFLIPKDIPDRQIPLDFVIDNMESSQLVILTAPGGTGKGWLELQLSLAIGSVAVQHKDGLWCPFKIWKKHKKEGEKVLFISVEDSRTVVINRLVAIRYYFKDKGLEQVFDDAMKNVDIIALGGGKIPHLMVKNGNQQDLPSEGELIKILQELLEQNKYRFIILDPLGKLHSLNEGSNEDMTFLLSTLEEYILKVYNTAVLISHHESKAGINRDMEADTAGGRGASALATAVRAAQTIQSMTIAEAKKRGIVKENNDVGEGETDDIDHEERLSWVQYRKAGKVNNSPRSNDDYVWLKRNEFGVLLPGTPPQRETKKPKKQKVNKIPRLDDVLADNARAISRLPDLFELEGEE